MNRLIESFRAQDGPAVTLSGVTVHVVEHPRGALMRIGHDGGSIVLDRDEALELYQLMQVHLGSMPSKP